MPEINSVFLNDGSDAESCSITITYTGGPTALITARGKDMDFGSDKLREIGYACICAAEFIEEAEWAAEEES